MAFTGNDPTHKQLPPAQVAGIVLACLLGPSFLTILYFLVKIYFKRLKRRCDERREAASQGLHMHNPPASNRNEPGWDTISLQSPRLPPITQPEGGRMSKVGPWAGNQPVTILEAKLNGTANGDLGSPLDFINPPKSYWGPGNDDTVSMKHEVSTARQAHIVNPRQARIVNVERRYDGPMSPANWAGEVSPR